jgi:hypothetical protein
VSIGIHERGAGANRRALSPTEALGVIAWFEWRTLLGAARLIRSSPGRFAAWAIWVAILVMAVVERAFSAHAGTVGGREPAGIVAALAPGALLVALGWRAHTATRRAPLRFSQPADSHFLPGSALSPAAVLTWLALRRMVVVVLRMLPAMGFVVLVDLSGLANGPFGLACSLTGLALAGMLVYMVGIPVWLLARRRRAWALPVRAVSSTSVVAGVLVVAATLLTAVHRSKVGSAVSSQRFLGELAGVRLDVPPGSWVAGALSGHPLGSLGLTALVGACVLSIWALAGECYPEVWQASAVSFRIQQLRRGGRANLALIRAARAEAGGKPLATTVRPTSLASRQGPGRLWLAGSWSLAWKEWTVAKRGGALRRAVVLTAVLAAAGTVAARLAWHSEIPAGALPGIGISLAYMSLLGGVSAIQRFAADLAQPLWWISPAPLRTRLAVATASGAMLVAVPILVAVAVVFVVVGPASVALGLLPAVLGLYWAMRAAGLLVFSMMPHRADLRGPGSIVRFLAMAVLAGAFGTAGGVVGALTHSAPAAFGAVAVAAACAGWVLVSLAAHRLEGNGMAAGRAAAQLA